MRYIAILVLLAFGPALYAELGRGDVSCRTGSEDNRPYKKKLWDGYEISLGPAANATEYGCTAAIYNSAGKVIFRTTGFGVIFDEGMTGEDFDGDGKPEVVFQTDGAGGAHCCWIYNVVSLSPKPHHLFDVGAGAGVRFEKDKAGKMVIWQWTSGVFGSASSAGQPYAEKVFRVRDGKLSDSTAEFCPEILAPGNRDYDEEKRILTPEKLKQLSGEIEKPDDGTANALLSRALQHTFCRQFDDALNDLNLWPEATRNEVKSDFADSIKNDYPEFAARLEK